MDSMGPSAHPAFSYMWKFQISFVVFVTFSEFLFFLYSLSLGQDY